MASWTAPIGGAIGYVVIYTTDVNQFTKTKDVSSTKTVLSELSAAVYDITVYAYKDIPSIAGDTVSLLLDGKWS